MKKLQMAGPVAMLLIAVACEKENDVQSLQPR